MNKNRIILLFLMIFALSVGVYAFDCHQYDETACNNATSCTWREDPWGSWCEPVGCWNLFSENECSSADNASTQYFINKTCSWSAGASSGFCHHLDCFAFEGTNASACVNNTYNLECEWIDEFDAANYQFPCMGPPEKSCWNYTSSSTCENVAGCTWGVCKDEDCWDYSNTNASVCESHVGMQGNACEWDTKYNECRESGCSSYSTLSDCQTNNCTWGGSSCHETTCKSYSWTKVGNCENNTKGLDCQWNSTTSVCTELGCKNYGDVSSCQSSSDCFWHTFTGGQCKEVQCFSYQSIGNCENNTVGLNCIWSGSECYENVTAKSCSNINSEKNCLDSMYCLWNKTASVCNDPSQGGIQMDFQAWNPGCYIFDTDQNTCTNTTGCDWVSGGCETNNSIIGNNQLNCSLLTNKTVCNSLPLLSSCCNWMAGECVEDKFSSSCRDQMEEPPEGAQYCDDYNSFTSQTLCNQIAGFPWYMPCQWNANESRCHFKKEDVFGSGGGNIFKIDNKKNCEVAGGKWIVESYCEGSMQVPTGRCEFKFEDERNCDKSCKACEYKSDKTNWASQSEAKSACGQSRLGICGFTSDTNAPNTYGYCEPKEEFKKGTAGDCKTDCASCAKMGDSTSSTKYTGTTASYDTCVAPSCYCSQSPAKCKWVADSTNSQDESSGACVSQSQKTCSDQCDKCYSESDCKNKGGKKGDSNAQGVCEWSGSICQYKSGADSLEICWDGIDNNNDNKMDCADSMCFTDPFCGGDVMFGQFGVDCFGFSDNTSCEGEGCVWINESWGEKCDMPFAACWKFDGTSQLECENNNMTGNGTCEWHSGFGGMCEGNWSIGESCKGLDLNTCNNKANCTWIQDTWCQDFGAICDPNPSYSGSTYYECWQHDQDVNATCSNAGTADSSGVKPCMWKPDPWCEQQGEDAGFCEHELFACSHNNATACDLAENCEWMMFNEGGGDCEPLVKSNCKNQPNATACSSAGCSWTSGFCDPKGFGGEMTFGMSSGGGGGPGGDSIAMGGFGMQCMQYDGNQTACETQTGCGWFDEPWPFCDINFGENCPQYTYNQTICEQHSLCKWNEQQQFCDEKPFECMWNTSLQNNLALCDAHPLCAANDGRCEPAGFSQADTQQNCTNLGNSFRWVNGWCNPAQAAKFFKGMDMGAPPVDLGKDPQDSGLDAEVDILDFGMKDMGQAYGFGVGVRSMNFAAACNNMNLMGGGKGSGTNKSTYYWYLDSDGNKTNNCELKYNSSQPGYEFYFKNSWTYDSTSGSVSDSPAAYRCSDGSWVKAEISVSSVRQMMCSMLGGPMIAFDLNELSKFSGMYDSEVDLRVAVASAGPNNNDTNPSDFADAGWATPGAFDFDFDGFDMFKFETDAKKKAGNVGADDGFIYYSENTDCWTESGCESYYCDGHPYCVNNSLGVEASSFEDTKMPLVIGMMKETYPDSAFVSYFTDKPANGTLNFYINDSTCAAASLNNIIADVGITNSGVEEYKLWHTAEVDQTKLGFGLNPDSTYYYRIKICDENGKCGASKCSNFTTETYSSCSFCRFVTKIKAPTGWEVKYDLDQDETYEHWQGHVCGENAGMKTNYTSGKRANILLTSTDNSSYVEFVNARITKTGLNSKTRDIDAADALKSGTINSTAGGSVGYAGMAEATRDKIINNLYPEKCLLRIPGNGTCAEFWHCDNNMTKCLNRTTEATLNKTGSDYCVWEVPDCQFSTWVGGQPGESSGEDGGDDGGNGGGGGGGGGAAVATIASTSETRVWTELKSGESVSMPVSKEDIPISKVEFTVNEQKTNAEIKVAGLGEKPSSVTAHSKKVYKYLEITPKIISTEDVSDVKINFKVGKSWVSDNNIDKNTIKLNRYVDDKWVELTTSSKGYDTDNYLFEATSPGFSYFAISAEESPQAEQEQVVVEEETDQEQAPAQTTEQESTDQEQESLNQEQTKEQKDVFKNILIVVVIVAVAILIPVLITFVKKKKA
ncbi:MAG: hypothetical protein MAG795_00808 [Candidatus Woesearchaeota archaeon]|nr:hypothetical protein [Candidatus Woesearchaeota archaeon]